MSIMGKEKAYGGGVGGSSAWYFLQELVRADIYKRTQGKLTRQITCIVIWVIFALGAWRLYSLMPDAQPIYKYAVPSVLLILGLWVGFRIVNIASFADFLIAVEAEMNKVSWPSQTELVRSSVVVIVLIFALTMILFAYDNIWYALLHQMGIVTY